MNILFALLRNPAVWLIIAVFAVLIHYYNRLAKARISLDEAQSKVDTLVEKYRIRASNEPQGGIDAMENKEDWKHAIDIYNEVAKAYNYRLESFPSGILAGMLNFQKAEFLTYSSFT